MTDISRLRVGNEDFLVTSMIERCPRSMMIRELIKNAMEAAVAADRPAIKVSAVCIDGVRKLAISNSGPGMTARELVQMCDIASSIRKANGLDENFGMGAKVATLPSNRHGIRYRSNRGGKVHQVVMGKRGDLYGRLVLADGSGTPVEVLDVTALALADGGDLSSDWTEVVLLGDGPHQDTVRDPYNGNPSVSENWIVEAICSRFFTFPPELSLTIDASCVESRRNVALEPIGAITSEFASYEVVRAPNGVAIHYLFDPGVEHGQALGANRLTASLIHRGEIYETLPIAEWRHDAPRFGIGFGALVLSVLIELPDDYPIRSDGYRQMLHYAENLQHRVHPRDFSALVSENRPGWLLELQRQWGPERQSLETHYREMEDLFRSLKVPRKWRPHDPQERGASEGEERPGCPADPSSNSAGDYEVSPEIIPLRDPIDVQDRGLEGKAARFYPESHQIFVNELYPAFLEFSEFLKAHFAAHGEPEEVRRLAQDLAAKYVTRAICRKVAFGISKRESWQGWEIDQALSSASLSLAADDTFEVRADAANEMDLRLVSATALDVAVRPPLITYPGPAQVPSQIEMPDGPRIILPKYMQGAAATTSH